MERRRADSRAGLAALYLRTQHLGSSGSGSVARDMTPIIQFKDVDYAIGGRKVLRNVSFQIERGEMLVLLGRSGSGKTTTLKMVNRLLQPTAGSVVVEGQSTAEWDPIRLRRRIGYVIQEVGLF